MPASGVVVKRLRSISAPKKPAILLDKHDDFCGVVVLETSEECVQVVDDIGTP